MAFGINVRNAAGTLTIGMTNRLTRFAYHTVAAAGASGSASVPGLIAANAIGFAVVRDSSLAKLPHVVTVTDGNVAWAPPVAGSVICDIYCVQYK